MDPFLQMIYGLKKCKDDLDLLLSGFANSYFMPSMHLVSMGNFYVPEIIFHFYVRNESRPIAKLCRHCFAFREGGLKT